MLERQDRLAGANVPQLDREVARSRGKDVFGRGVEEDLSDFSEQGVSNGDKASLVWCAYLEWPVSLMDGETSWTSSPGSVWRVKFCGTSQTKTFPSSDAEAMMRSLKGCLVSC